MEDFKPGLHITQSEKWGDFKALMGTPPVRVDDIQFTKHKIGFLPYYVGYAPRVNFDKQKFSWKELKTVAKQEKCVMIRFDVPNVIKSESIKSTKWYKELEKGCKKAPRDTFARWNILLDITPPEEQLIKNFHSKTRYNARLSARKGVVVKIENNEKGLTTFLKLQRETAKRQNFLIHSDDYYRKVFETFNTSEDIYILVAYLDEKPVASWMLLKNKDTIFYPYGGSSAEHRNLMASNLLGWEAIRLGKKSGCKIFDMWGATNNRANPWWGFTKFKLGYGGELVEYIESYDLVINPVLYFAFNLTYTMFWGFQKLRRRK